MFSHVRRISITEPSLQRPDILVYKHQHQQLSSSSKSTPGCVVVASTQSNLIILYSLPLPQAQSEGVLSPHTLTPPVSCPSQGKITLPPDHFVRGVCFGSGLGIGSDDNHEEKQEVWVLSLMKAMRGTTSLASIGDPLPLPSSLTHHITSHILAC